MPTTLLSNKESEVTSAVNPSRWLKYVFLSFAQAYFNTYPAFKWEPNRTTTKIIIQDKYSINTLNTEKIPAIIFNKGNLTYMKTSLNQSIGGANNSVNIGYPQDKIDLLRGNCSFSCLSKDQITGEHVADLLSFSMYSCREQFREKGIHSISNISIGETIPIKMEVAGNKVDMFNTPVYVNVDFQINFLKNVDFDGPLHESVDLALRGSDNVDTVIAENITIDG